jgi:RimJ/RimL family protein N-acetyltransferase
MAKAIKNTSGPAYRIETPRLVLRCWDPEDAPLLDAAVEASLDHLRPWMPWAHEPRSPEGTVQRLRQFRARFDLDQDYFYGIFNPQETAVLGGTGLHTRAGERAREIGYWIHVDHIGRGLATETAAALVQVAFEIDAMDRVEIHCGPDNVRSQSVPRKLGFAHEATLRRRFQIGEDQLRDTMIWSLFADDYAHSPAFQAEVAAFDALGRRIAAQR